MTRTMTAWPVFSSRGVSGTCVGHGSSTPLMIKEQNDPELSFMVERVTGIEPASRAWEPSNNALVQALTSGQPWSGVTPVDPY